MSWVYYNFGEYCYFLFFISEKKKVKLHMQRSVIK